MDEEKHPLEGQCIKATQSIILTGHLVDDRIYFAGDMFIPRINYGDKFYVESVDNQDIVILKNLTRKEWGKCEISLDEIEEFKVIRKDEI